MSKGVNDEQTLAGFDTAHSVDAIFINSPLKNYDISTRYNDFTLPVLGLGYIATYAHKQGLNVAVLDAEAHGMGISRIISLVNGIKPRWVGLNLLAPTYRYGIEILQGLDPEIAVMLGGHQAKAMPERILADTHIPRIDALILGEGEYRVEALLQDINRRSELPDVWWRNQKGEVFQGTLPSSITKKYWLAPDINTLPFINRAFLFQDPFKTEDGITEANLVGSRGCPYDCSFCGAAISANPDISIRARDPENIIDEIKELNRLYNATAFRFVDDMFLTSLPFIKKCLTAFKAHGMGERFQWDATGRINILSKTNGQLLDLIREAGCREVALGIESGNERLLNYMGKKITPAMTKQAVQALTSRGVNVKGYFIFGYPTETWEELQESIRLIYDLWEIADKEAGTFRCSAFEFRPYPGTPEWHRIIATGRYKEDDLLLYESVDLTSNGLLSEMLERDEFNFSVNLQFGEVPITKVREYLTKIMVEQKQRSPIKADHVQQRPLVKADRVQRINLAVRT